MGVAPPKNWGRISSIQPRAHGGNIDNKELIAGTTLYLPVLKKEGCFPAAMDMPRKGTAKSVSRP